ncbi:MAG TPA: phosphatidylserine decarboxylase family protein [Pyrinomonadaceae bacterium]|nr:phosphatidylserine decarboxylase family protein [Pyrinomonadaceae bacterium]
MSIVREGFPYILAPALGALLLFVFGYWVIGILLVLLTLSMAFFFRDPRRKPPSDPNLVVAPADGRVTRVRKVVAEEDGSPTLVSIFLSPLDVHVNRAPIAGLIRDISYVPGKFLMATNEMASTVNEQNALTIEGEKVTVVCKQIAGILARRVVCWKQKGDRVSLGERFGLIKFSSRTDVILPRQVEVLVQEGSRVQGGTTVIGRIR